LILVSIVIVAAVFTFGYAFRGAENSVEKIDASYSITANELFNAFDSDETAANEKFLGKVIEVKGTIGEFEKTNNGFVVIKLSSDSPMGGVSCSFETNQDNILRQAEKGGNITIKGTCSGMLMEVILDKCAVVD